MLLGAVQGKVAGQIFCRTALNQPFRSLCCESNKFLSREDDRGVPARTGTWSDLRRAEFAHDLADVVEDDSSTGTSPCTLPLPRTSTAKCSPRRHAQGGWAADNGRTQPPPNEKNNLEPSLALFSCFRVGEHLFARCEIPQTTYNTLLSRFFFFFFFFFFLPARIIPVG